MRTLAILLLATVNLTLLVSVSLPLFRHDASVPVVTAPEPQEKVATEAKGGSAGPGTPASHSPSAAAPVSNTAASDHGSNFLYVKGSGGAQGVQGDRVERDGKTVADLKDVKDVEPIAELLPGGEKVLAGPGTPNSEFVTNTLSSKQSSTNDPGESSSPKSLGILSPAQRINTVPPTVSEESPL